jgi:hypothetical protein
LTDLIVRQPPMKRPNAHTVKRAKGWGIVDTLWTMEDIAGRIEVRRPRPGKSGPSKTRALQEPSDGMSDIGATLVELADEHLARMGALPWAALAKSMAQGRTGETFGCEIDGCYFDVGDSIKWAHIAGGDILLTAFAQASDGRRVERVRTLRPISS